MRTSTKPLLKALGCALSVALLAPVASLAAGLTDLASEPLAQPAANVKPNIMLLIDDSGSMRQQYTPDYIGRFTNGSSNALCLDSLDSGGTITSNLQNCEAGDPPIMSADFNTQYYNPQITYYPAVNYDGTSMPEMNSANTDGWTEVPTDGVSPSTMNVNRYDTVHMFPAYGEPTVTTSNLVSDYPDRVWCDSQSASATDTTHCKQNSAYTYPNQVYGYGLTTGGSVKFVYGAPYYYLIVPTYYCTDATLTTCIKATSPTTVSGVYYGVPAPVRYCSDVNLTNCEAKYRGSYTRPAFTGIVTTYSTTPVSATATITVASTQTNPGQGVIDTVALNGVNVLTAPITSGPPISPNSVAQQIALQINAYGAAAGNPAYQATVSTSGNQITITAPSTPDYTSYNGYTVNVSSPPPTAGSTTPAYATIQFYNINNRAWVSGITVNSVQLMPSTVQCNGCGNNSSTRAAYLAQQVAAQINAGTSGYSASYGADTVTITAPAGTGSDYNGLSLSVSSRRLSISPSSPTLANGVTPGAIDVATTNFSGGIDANSGRTDVGDFVRTNIVPGQSYPKYPGRTDCSDTNNNTCTYADEMTNFANWYAYYRTRNEMAKTAIGRAFASLTDGFRVGYITINPGNPVSSSRYLAIDDFNSGAGNQRNQWYQLLYATPADSGTPLRIALSRVGQYLALGGSGTLTSGMGDSPIQVACQPNYTVLVTDGYWNGSSNPENLSGSSVGNQDNTDSGFHTRAIGAYDGGLAGATNTLADTAMYYYQTDLRPDLPDEVPTTQTDPNPAQHMDLFTVGLGLAGLLTYDPNYLSENSSTGGDFYDIKQGSLNWPVPVSNTETALDDLWHAAVDGHGQFFSAKDPSTLALALSSSLSNVSARIGAGAAAATSNLEPVAGDNFAFTAQYQTVEWTGDLTARTIDLSTGIVATAALWSAQSMLDQRTPYDRNIYTFDPTDTIAGGGQNGNLLTSFCWPGAYATGNYPTCGDGSGLTSTEMGYFNPLTLPQATTWSSAQQSAATANNLVDYLRGDTTNESTGGTATTDLYRKRADLLGDIVDAQPAYVKTAPFGYDSGSYAGTDPYYQDFKASTDGTTGTRAGTVFAAANDGMLHAFNTEGPNGEIYYQTGGITTTSTADDTFTGTLVTDPINGQGSERWAFIPSMVLPNLKNLADIPYSHQYYTDGSPAVGDVCFGATLSTPCSSASNWHTILVAGLNGGGRGYYALDVTDPNNPKGLWEFSTNSSTPCLTNAQVAASASGTTPQYQDCNLGYSFGNPLIVKRPSDGRWVVIVPSGYNNVNPGNGQGYLYVLDAQTGQILDRIGTGVGCDGVSTTPPCVSGSVDPSGLNHINAWVDNAYYDNTAMRIYGIDLKGNVWRFQLDPTAAGYDTAFKLETLTDPSGNPQPITTKPELAQVNGYPVVYVATGQLLGTSDLGTTQVQSIYALRDDLTLNPLPDVRSSGKFVQQTLTLASGSTTTRTATNNPVDFGTNDGWWIDLPAAGERVNVDPQLQLGTLIVASNVPSNDTCVAGGSAWLNYLDYQTGSFVPGATANMASTQIAASLVVGINVVKLPGGSVKSIVTTADNQQITQTAPVAPSTVQGRRVSWRELIVQ